MKPLYISATVKDCGKTSVNLGLIQLLRGREQNPGYIKPVGQNYVQYEDHNVDEDAVLIRDALDFDDPPQYMSPIAIERGFTRRFIENPDVKTLENRILQAQQEIAAAHPVVMVEGTGHAGVGSCFGLSNARVAQLTDSKVVIVTTGGIGRPIDEIALSLTAFRHQGVEVAGVILNKVLPEKLQQVQDTVSRGLELLGTRLLGTIPYEEKMSTYTLKQVADEFGYTVLAGSDSADNRIEHVLVAAMEPQNALHYMAPRSLIITPGDRTDIILMTMTLSGSQEYHDTFCSGGLVLTGGLLPDKTILDLLKRSSIPVLTTNEETYTVTARMKDLAFKIQVFDKDKIEATRRLVGEHVDVGYILDSLNS